MTLADIRLLILRTGLSQAGVARLCGIKPETAGKWLAGKLQPRPEHIAALERLNAEQDSLARAMAAALGALPALHLDLGLIRDMPSDGARMAVARRVADLIAPRRLTLADGGWQAEALRLRTGLPPMGIEAIAEHLGIAKSAVHRAVQGAGVDLRAETARRQHAERREAAEKR